MPYVSSAQRGYLHAQHPDIAARWDAEERKEGGEHHKLPRHVKKGKKKHRKGVKHRARHGAKKTHRKR
jgi:hypothetical protein